MNTTGWIIGAAAGVIGIGTTVAVINYRHNRDNDKLSEDLKKIEAKRTKKHKKIDTATAKKVESKKAKMEKNREREVKKTLKVEAKEAKETVVVATAE